MPHSTRSRTKRFKLPWKLKAFKNNYQIWKTNINVGLGRGTFSKSFNLAYILGFLGKLDLN